MIGKNASGGFPVRGKDAASASNGLHRLSITLMSKTSSYRRRQFSIRPANFFIVSYTFV